MDTWILKKIRTANSRRFTTWVATCVCVILLVGSQTRYIQNFIKGPYELSKADLDAIKNAASFPKYFAKVTGSEAIDMGLQQITVRTRHGIETGRSVSASYYVLVFGEKLLICKSGSDAQSTTIEGELAPIPADLEQQVFADPEIAKDRDHFYDFYITDEQFRMPGYFAIGGLVIFAFFLLRGAVPAWKYSRDPSLHPLIKRISDWGDQVSVDMDVEREMSSNRFTTVSGWILTDKYLIRSSFFSFDVLRFQDLLWGYKKVTQHRVNFVPTGKTYAALLICYGGAATIQAHEQSIDSILTYASERAPWAIYGYSKEIETFFNKSMGEFCATIEERRREHERTAGVTKPA